MTVLLLVLATVIPLLLLSVVVGLRAPLAMLALYAAIIPFGSGFRVPLPLPRPFDTLSTLIGLVATVAIITHIVVARRRAPVIVRAMPIWVLFLGLTTLSLVWSVNQSETVANLAVLFSLVGLYVVATLVDVRWPDVRRVEAGTAIGGAITGCFALFLWATGAMPVNAGGTPRFQTAGGGSGASDPNITAATLLLPLAVALGRGMSASRPAVRLAYFGATGLSLLAIILTASRGGILAAGVVIVVLAVNSPRKTHLVSYVLAGLVTVGLVVALAPDRVAQEGSTGRTDIWKVGIHACAEHCWTGSGWGTFPDVHQEHLLSNYDAQGRSLTYKAHNIWIRAAIEAGLVGLALMAAGLLVAARDLIPLPQDVRGPPLAALAGLVVSNMFLSNLDFKYFWMTLLYAAIVTIAWHANVQADATTEEARLSGTVVR